MWVTYRYVTLHIQSLSAKFKLLKIKGCFPQMSTYLPGIYFAIFGLWCVLFCVGGTSVVERLHICYSHIHNACI